jgi:hypothetical protein
MQWTDWPAQRRPWVAAVAACVIVASVALLSAEDRALAALAALVLLSATAEALLPTRYELAADGIRLDNPLRRRRRDWQRVRAWRLAPDGFLLEPRGRAGFLRRRGSLWLRCPGREAEVEAFLRARLGEPAP